MKNMKDRRVLVTGGTRGLGRGIVEALVASGAKVTVIARDAAQLEGLRLRLKVGVEAGDVKDGDFIVRVLRETQPDDIILNAGAVPPMAPIGSIGWDDFSKTWNEDVRAGLNWVQAILKSPLKSGSRVYLTSSGAAWSGSQGSGGYAGAKRMLTFLAEYADSAAQDAGLGIRFLTLTPRQMIGGTGVGDQGSGYYARGTGITKAQFLTRFGKPMPPRAYGDLVVQVMADEKYAAASDFHLRGEDGITAME